MTNNPALFGNSPIISASADNPHIIHGYADQIATQESYRLDFGVGPSGRMLMANASVVDRQAVVDVSWLPAASEAYSISPNIKDYVIAEIPIVEGDIPNRNMDCFLTSRLVEFSAKAGMQNFRTFVGKPTHLEHAHDDPLKAKGVIFDASMREVNGRWFVNILAGFDRTKDQKLAEDILSGRRKGHSMSAWTENFDCSVCGHRWDTSYPAACDHMKGPHNMRVAGRYAGKGQIYNDQLCYAICHAATFFESSSVGDPANYAAMQLQQTSI